MSNGGHKSGPRVVDIPIRRVDYAAHTQPTPEQAAALLGEMLPNLEKAILDCKNNGGEPTLALFAATPLGNLVAAQFGAEVFVANVKAVVLAVLGRSGDVGRIIVP